MVCFALKCLGRIGENDVMYDDGVHYVNKNVDGILLFSYVSIHGGGHGSMMDRRRRRHRSIHRRSSIHHHHISNQTHVFVSAEKAAMSREKKLSAFCVRSSRRRNLWGSRVSCVVSYNEHRRQRSVLL